MALATSKRKFYKLLDNLSKSNLSQTPSENPSETSLNPDNSLQQSADRPIKRSRMLNNQVSASPRPATTPVRRPGTATVVGSRTSVRIISSNFESRSSPSASSKQQQQNTSPVNGTTNSTPPKVERPSTPSVYAPWNQAHFLARLKTFADVKAWNLKPSSVDEVVWAKRGWSNVGPEEVGCVSCGKRLVVKLESNSLSGYGKGDKDVTDENGKADGEKRWWIEDAEKKLIERYESLIVEGHADGCLWRKGGCKDDIYRIKFSDVTVWQTELCGRYNSLVAMSKELPSNVIVPPTFHRSDDDGFTIDDISKWFKSAMAESKLDIKEPASINKVALTLALCGWGGEKIAGVQFAYCQRCFSRVGFWLYSGSDDSMKLDPITLHRAYCPWQNGESQHALGEYADLAGWEVLAKVISVRMSRTEKRKAAGNAEDDGESSSIRPGTSISTMSKTREEVDAEDRIRDSKLARLKKAFTVKKAKSKASLKSNFTSNNV